MNNNNNSHTIDDKIAQKLHSFIYLVVLTKNKFLFSFLVSYSFAETSVTQRDDEGKNIEEKKKMQMFHINQIILPKIL